MKRKKQKPSTSNLQDRINSEVEAGFIQLGEPSKITDEEAMRALQIKKTKKSNRFSISSI